MFTRQHYKVIGDIIRSTPRPVDDYDIQGHLVKEFCELFESDNPRFDRQCFIDYMNREVD